MTDSMLAGTVPNPFEALFAVEYERVVAIARRFVGADAEDVAQEVFAGLIRARPSDAAHARAWLHRATVHRALDALRARRRRTANESRSVRLEPVVTGNDPADGAECAERAAAVRRVLGRLPERYAGVLALRAAGLSYKEIAAVEGVTPNAIGTLLVRAEAALRKEISGDPSFA
jgi:RNA polymerase sigma factor (sigma-70 family)